MKERFSNVKQRLGKSIPWRDHTHGGEIAEASEMSTRKGNPLKSEGTKGAEQRRAATAEGTR
jgi:hypothetical protein